jgi:PAS domain S-box-containing protein
MADTPDNRDDQPDMHGEIEQLRNEVDRLRSRDVAQELKLSEAKYRALIEGSSDFIYVLDKEGCFTFANQEVENLLGYTPDEILGKHYSAILLAEDLASLKYAFAERRTGERATHQLEIRLRSRSGVTGDVDMDIRHCSLSASGIYQDEAYWGTHGVARDISERKYQATKQLALQQLHRSIWTMTRADDIHPVLTAIRDCLHTMEVPYGEFGVYVLDLGEPPIVHFYGTYDSAEITKKGQWMVTDAESFAGHTMGVWQSGEMVHSRVLENDTTHHYRDRLAEFFGDINSIIDIPFSHGVLTVTTKDGTRFSSRNISFVRELAEALSDGFRRMEGPAGSQALRTALPDASRNAEPGGDVDRHRGQLPLHQPPDRNLARLRTRRFLRRRFSDDATRAPRRPGRARLFYDHDQWHAGAAQPRIPLVLDRRAVSLGFRVALPRLRDRRRRTGQKSEYGPGGGTGYDRE